MRFPRPAIENCCIHVTHRCHGRRFLLNTDIDRRQYVRRLWEARNRFRRVEVLDYVVTSNHVHLLVWVPRMAELSAMMKWLQGTFAGDYNRRRRREGSFWRGRFHSTLVQTGRHLQRCLLYVDMNIHGPRPRRASSVRLAVRGLPRTDWREKTLPDHQF